MPLEYSMNKQGRSGCYFISFVSYQLSLDIYTFNNSEGKFFFFMIQTPLRLCLYSHPPCSVRISNKKVLSLTCHDKEGSGWMNKIYSYNKWCALYYVHTVDLEIGQSMGYQVHSCSKLRQDLWAGHQLTIRHKSSSSATVSKTDHPHLTTMTHVTITCMSATHTHTH